MSTSAGIRIAGNEMSHLRTLEMAVAGHDMVNLLLRPQHVSLDQSSKPFRGLPQLITQPQAQVRCNLVIATPPTDDM